MADQRDLVLSPVQYAFVQDGSNSGNVRVLVGPLVDPLSGNDRLVMWTGRKFMEQPDVDQARMTFVTANENQYVVLSNPAQGDHESFPPVAKGTTAVALDVGKRIVIRGPVTFPLWPGQMNEVIDGHRLARDEYLSVQVYDPEAAEANQERAVAEQTDSEGEAVEAVTPRQFTRGEQIVIKGTDVSFYIPPTGIEVLREERNDGKLGGYIRKAAVVEQLEYVSLVSESGRKRVVRGPAVVFPEPDEQFQTERGERKFRAIELSTQSGVYIKVTESYAYDGERPLKKGAWRGDRMVEINPGDVVEEGDELFLTGADAAIYFPLTQHAIIEYGEGKRKHYAISIPAGDSRYVLDRMGDGGVTKVVGAKMFLPDPRTEVIVRRVLEPKTVNLWYPQSPDAMLVNQELAGVQATTGEEYLASMTAQAQNVAASSMASTAQAGALARSYPVMGGVAADRFKRGTEYTPSRTITLGGKYEGAPRVSVWPGYAVMVMDPTGNRRVEVGPVDLLLEYHETLMALTLSTGRPKGTGQPLQTVYLRTINNAVGDRITVETRDLVPVTIEVSLRVNFEAEEAADRNRWFYVEDYVSLLTDHVRSKVRNLAKQHEVQEFYANTPDLIRNYLLGSATEEVKRPGYGFPENGMHLYDVEILNVTIDTPGVKLMLDKARDQSLIGAIEVSQEEEATRRQERLEALRRQRLAATEETREAQIVASLAEIERRATASLRSIDVSIREAEEGQKVTELERANRAAAAKQELDILRDRNLVEMERIRGEVDQFVKRVGAVDPQLAEAIRVFGQEQVTRELVVALGGFATVHGVSAVDILGDQLKGTALSPVLDALREKPYARVLENGARE